MKGESLKIILIILCGWTCFSFADASTKYLSENYDSAFIISLGALFSTTPLCAWILYDKGWKGFYSPHWKWLVVRALCVGTTATGLVNAVSYIPLADLYGITFSAPFITLFLAYFILKEHVGWHRWFAVSIGFAGVLVLVGPQFEILNIGIIYAILGTVSIALGTIVIRKIGVSVYFPLFILYSYLGMIVVNLPFAITTLHVPPLSDLMIFVPNALCVLGGMIAITYGFAHAKQTAGVAPFVYVQVIWGTILGYFFFNNIPTMTTLAGLSLIISAGLYMIYRENQLRKLHA
jgi:drug/metabolite transporter (DMT)-like permease